MVRLGAGGLLIVIATITGFIGGAMTFTKKSKQKLFWKQALRDALTSSNYIHPHQLDKYLGEYVLPGYCR